MKLIVLSSTFYEMYGHYPEILDKSNRPYYCLALSIDGHTFAIPFRHHIKHAYCFNTIGEAGLDYSKAVPVDNPAMIGSETPWIDSKEWRIIRKNEQKIFASFHRYIRQYKRALKNKDNPRSERILKYSALQYFDITG